MLVAAGLLRATPRDRFAPIAALLLAAGLLLSGSRAGFLLLLAGALILLLAGGLASRERLTALVLFAAAALGGALFLLRGSEGTLGTRLAQSFDPSLPIEYRVSARPLLWRAAGRLFLRHPVEGAGMGVFSWRFPDLMREENRRFLMRDNPGSAYVQALAETGAAGFLLTAFFVVSLGALALRRAREKDVLVGGAGVAIARLSRGSRRGLPLVCSRRVSSLLPPGGARGRPRARQSLGRFEDGEAATPWLRRSLLVLILLYAVAAGAAVLATARPEEAFRYSPRIGFHDEEVGPGGPFRWTRRKFALWVEPGADASRSSLAHYSPSGKPVDVDGDAARPDRLPARRSRPAKSATLALERLAGRGRGRSSSTCRSAFVPKRLGLSQDRRELALLSIEPDDRASSAPT